MAPIITSRGSKVALKEWKQSEPEEEFNGFDTGAENAESDKDSTEEELEKLVFGDSSGFRDGIKAYSRSARSGKGKELVLAKEESEPGIGFENIDDADLFFLDSGPSDLQDQPLYTAPTSDDEEGIAREAAAWSDSDDERIQVSLATRPQLRKLRRTEAEDVITGKEYSRRLRKQYQILNPAPEWARSSRPRKKRRTSSDSSASDSSSEDGMDVDEDDLSAQPLARLLQDADSLTRRTDSGATKRKLRSEVIDIQRMKDIVSSGPSAITTLQVHPKLPLLISSGPSSNISLHHLHPHPPTPNPLLTTLHIKNTPMSTSLFHPSPSDARIFLGSRRRYMHIWNLSTGIVEKLTRIYGHQDEQKSMEHFKLSPDGQHIALLGSARKGGGVINILDATTLQWTAQARVESFGGVADFAWWSNSSGLVIAGKNGEITEWDLESRIAVARWNDDGAVGTTTIALGGSSGREALGGDRYIVIGSSSGITNIYHRRPWATASAAGAPEVPKNPKPTRVFDQLTTPISHLHFSPDGQLLVMASKWKGDALRLVHLPSCTVYRNWPTGKTPFGRISAVAFGVVEGETVLLVGNEKGAVRGWEIRG